MAHELEMVNGKAQMAYAGDVPWHGLGVKIDPNISPEEMMKAAGLDWEVGKRRLYAKVGKEYIKSDREALIRLSDNKILSYVSEDWEPCQNADAFKFFKEYCDMSKYNKKDGMQMHTAGSLFDGQKIWVLAKVNESFTLFNGDQVDSYLLFSNPHEYGKSIDVRFTPIRVVCNNTLTLSLGSKSKTMVRLNHRRKFNADEVKKMLGIASTKLNSYKTVAELLGKHKYNDKNVKAYLGEVFPYNGKKEGEDGEKHMALPARMAYEALETQPGAEFAKHSWWTAFNAVTYTLDHLAGHGAETRLNSAWYGANREKKVIALEKAVEYAKA